MVSKQGVADLTLTEVRRICLSAQGLSNGSGNLKGKAGALAVIERLGYVQIDTIAVIERAHHHVIWTRHPGYRPEMLDALLSVDRSIFEAWTHAASYAPTSDYRYFLHRMRAVRESDRARSWMKENRKLVRGILERIRNEGPLASVDFKDTRKKRGSWWDWKPAKRALEVLLSTGDLMVAERRNFQRLYDLTDRVLPPDTDTREPDAEAFGRHLVRRTIAAHGIVSDRDLQWIRKPHRALIRSTMDDLAASGELVPVKVSGCEAETHYASPEALELPSGRRRRREVHLLSPFDNAVINRYRLARLFDFDYTIECYVPEPKRKYGYFCLPILWGDRFIGRLDAKADRATGVLIVRKLIFEKGFGDHEAVLPTLARKLHAFAGFCACEQTVVESTSPVKVRSAVRRAVAECA
jgi:uncharacterized protein